MSQNSVVTIRIYTTLFYQQNSVMSVVIQTRGRARSRGSSGGGGVGRRRVGSKSRSMSSLMSKSIASLDGRSKRGWSYPQQGTSFFFDPFPVRMRAMLRYSEVISLNPTLGSTAHQLFRCNSIFDPNQTGIGHQPYGRDTYASIYDHYTVLKSEIKITTVGATQYGTAGITLTDDSTVNAQFDTVREVKPTKMMIMNTGCEPISITQQYDGKKVFGPDFGRQSSSMGVNPIDEHFFDLWYQGAEPGYDPTTQFFQVNITYYCEFFELKDLGGS